MNKRREGNFFEHFAIGQRFVHATPRTLQAADQSLYIALTGSRACLHSATTSARQLGFDRRPLEDLLVFNTAFGKTVPDISLNAIANLGYAELRFLAPVYADDTLAVQSEVIGLKENSSGKNGVVYVRSTANNQDGVEVLTWVRWVMVHKRDANAPAPATTLPSLAAQVEPQAMAYRHFTGQVVGAPQVTRARELWEDYEVGERIDHVAAMTLNDSDHSMATRLYQNTAKAHFDAQAMAASPAGRRLVYGGHVMSVCKALSYDGLENVLTILAIHGGRHMSPCFAGDTLCCATTVIDKHDFGDAPVGGLRLRMIGAKDTKASSSIEFPTDENRQKTLVLDLDFTVAIPKRDALSCTH